MRKNLKKFTSCKYKNYAEKINNQNNNIYIFIYLGEIYLHVYTFRYFLKMKREA